MKIIFDVLHLYYLPQYFPVYRKLVELNVDVHFLFYRSEDEKLQRICENVIKSECLPVTWVEDWDQALEYYMETKPDWIVFGNAVKDIELLHRASKTALMQHGIGPKSCYYDVSENPTTVRFVEGNHRLERLRALYPEGNFFDSGYAKLDSLQPGQPLDLTLESLGLRSDKKTLLYAPTYYPSSIELFSKSFAEDFSDYNIIIKPHFFSLTKKKYKNQRKLLERFARSENVYMASVEDYNLIPFMAISDVMLSDASSAIFEFAALNKPVVWCDFYKVRWGYRGIFKFRLKNRIDSDIEYFNQVAVRVSSYKDLPTAIKNIDENSFIQRQTMITKLAGSVDGLCSDRIANYLLNY